MAKQRDKKKVIKEIELKNRIDKLEMRLNNMDTNYIKYLVETIQMNTTQLNNLDFTIQYQQKFIIEKELKEEYEEWLKVEINKLTTPAPVEVQDEGGKIKTKTPLQPPKSGEPGTINKG